MEPLIYSASELLFQMKEIFQNHLGWVAVRGEITGFKTPRPGHSYFGLKDEEGVLNAVMFRAKKRMLTFVPEDGMEVICWGLCTVYERRGALQLAVELMERVGQGSLDLAFEQLKARLKQEGLFDEKRKKPLPYQPRKIALVTSSTGAAIRDLLHVLRRRSPSCSLLLVPCQVQGVGAAEQVVQAIESAQKVPDVELIILSRGGGSSEDLWTFNEEIVARAVAASQIPILTGIGHETDTSIADLVADASAPTPSAAAELAVIEDEALLTELSQLERRLQVAMSYLMEQKKMAFKSLSEQLRSPKPKVVMYRQQLKTLEENLGRVLKHKMTHSQQKLGELAKRLDALSPLRVLQRGYALVHDKDDQLVRDVVQLKAGDSIRVTLAKGELQAEVIDLKKNAKKKLLSSSL